MLRSRTIRRLGAALALTVALAVAPPATATVVIESPRVELVERSQLIVRAFVDGATSRWNEDGSQLITLTALRVTEYIKGNGPATLTLRQLGGRLGDIASHIPGDARFANGQEVFLFLRQGSGVVYLTALSQSAYYIRRDNGEASVSRELHGLSFARRSATGTMQIVEPPSETPETLTHLDADVRRLMGGSR